MNLKVTISQNPAQLGARKLQSFLDAAKGRPVLLMLSGGSAFSLLEAVDISIALKNVTLVVLDERYGTDGAINNFAQLVKMEFYKKSVDVGARFIDTRVVPGETFSEMEVRFDYALKSWRKDNPDGVIIVTMGIGPDGHTAGIFTHRDNEKFRYLFEQGEKFVAGYHAHQSEYHERLTVTNHFLREYVDQAIVYVAGKNKREALQAVLSEHGDLSKTPARIIREMKDVEFFTDLNI